MINEQKKDLLSNKSNRSKENLERKIYVPLFPGAPTKHQSLYIIFQNCKFRYKSENEKNKVYNFGVYTKKMPF